MKRIFWLVIGLVLCSSAHAQLTPTPDPIGDGSPVLSQVDCDWLLNMIRLTRDFAIPAQDARVDEAFENWLVKSEEQAVAYAAWRDCGGVDYQRLMLAWQAAVRTTGKAREAYEYEKGLLEMLRQALAMWTQAYKDGGCK